MRAVGDYQQRVVSRASNCTAALREELRADGIAFDAEIEKLLKLLWDDVVKEGRALNPKMLLSATVGELKAQLASQASWRKTHAQHLTFNGVHLQDDRALSSYGITEGARLRYWLKPKLRGGMQLFGVAAPRRPRIHVSSSEPWDE